MKIGYALLVTLAASHVSAQLVTLGPGSGRLLTRAATLNARDEDEINFATPSFFERSISSSLIGGTGIFNWDIRSNVFANTRLNLDTASEFEMDTFGLWSASANVLNTAGPSASASASYRHSFFLSSPSLITLTNRLSGPESFQLSNITNDQFILSSTGQVLFQNSSSYNQTQVLQIILPAGSYFTQSLTNLTLFTGSTQVVSHFANFENSFRAEAVPEPASALVLAGGVSLWMRKKNRRTHSIDSLKH